MPDLRPISHSVATLAKETFARKFVSLGRILTHWNDIVGPELAGRAQPVKLHYRKPKSAQDKPQASLDIAVSSADASLLHYQKDLILERLNHVFGERWITSIRFVHTVANTQDDDLRINPLAGISLTPEQEIALQDVISGVTDEDIRNKLEKLGQGVLKKRNRSMRPS